MSINLHLMRILLVPLSLLLPVILAAQLPRGNQQVRIVELDPTLGLNIRQLIDGKGDLKSWDLSIDSQSPLANLPSFVDREAPIFEIDCFYPDLKLVYRDYTYILSTHCGTIHKFRNLKPWQPSRYPLADDFIFTESLIRYFYNLKDSLFGGRFDAFFEALSETTPSAYTLHLQNQGKAQPEILLSAVEITSKRPEPSPPQPSKTTEPKPITPTIAADRPERPLPARRGDARDTPQPPQRRNSVPKIIHTPTSGSDLPSYMKPQPTEKANKSDEDNLLEIARKDEFELQPYRNEPETDLNKEPLNQLTPTLTSEQQTPPLAHQDPESHAEPQAHEEKKEAEAPATAEVTPPAPARPPRPQPILTQPLAGNISQLPPPRIQLPSRPLFDSNSLFAIIVTEPEIMPEPEPSAVKPEPVSTSQTEKEKLVAAKPEVKPQPSAPAPATAKGPTPAPSPKPTPPAPASKPATTVPDPKTLPKPVKEAEENLDVDIGMDEFDAQTDDDSADEDSDNLENLMDDDRDGFIDESDSTERELNALFGDDDEDLDLDEDDDLDFDDF